jgi:hypothetical protein
MPRRASVAAVPDEPPTETAVDVALSVLHAIAEDQMLRSSHRQRAREFLRQIRKADQRDLRADSHRDDPDEEEDEFG